ncbi:MAG: aminopeptidase [Phycisphaerales bacterium]|nr:aminopeptidase [Phycisphaerales bacterium]MCB9854144.1 aminopeptidase [Phycisphaerales bacterium]MCB9864720.1 aminopeptidase [Phycisphaerales bacterium]
MPDPRITRLADVLINYSCAVKPEEKILIEAIDVPHFFTSECVRLAREAGGLPIVKLESNEIKRAQMMHGSRASWEFVEACENHVMKQVDCYIGARGSFNVSELSDVPGDKQALYENTVWKNVHIVSRVKHTRWVVLRWPHPSMAQMAEMSTPAFEDYYFNVCTLDYARMAKAMIPLKVRMEQTDRVRLLGPRDTDLTFSIKGIPAVPCDGKLNIPDGEVFTAPVRESINGVIQYNAPSLYRGTTHTDVRFEFKNGKIVNATSSSTQKLNEVLDADAGARYCGEFAIGFNPYCTRPMKDILFDEKIAGSIHLTPGACYDDAPNGNKSDIHWDLVLIQRPEYGGGEMYFDDTLVRKDGEFVVDDLKGLNPASLTA